LKFYDRAAFQRQLVRAYERAGGTESRRMRQLVSDTGGDGIEQVAQLSRASDTMLSNLLSVGPTRRGYGGRSGEWATEYRRTLVRAERLSDQPGIDSSTLGRVADDVEALPAGAQRRAAEAIEETGEDGVRFVDETDDATLRDFFGACRRGAGSAGLAVGGVQAGHGGVAVSGESLLQDCSRSLFQDVSRTDAQNFREEIVTASTGDGRLSDTEFYSALQDSQQRETIIEGVATDRVSQQALRTVRESDLAGGDGVTALESIVDADVPVQTLGRRTDSLSTVARMDHGFRFTGSQSGVDLDVRYVDDWDGFISQFDNPQSLSNGQLGELIGARAIRQRTNVNDPDFQMYEGYDENVNANGPDFVYRDPDTGELVVEEVKFLDVDGRSVYRSDLGSTTNGQQLSDEYLRAVIRENRGISSETASVLRTARRNGNIRTEFTVVENNAVDGRTIGSNLANSDIADRVNLFKIGDQR